MIRNALAAVGAVVLAWGAFVWIRTTIERQREAAKRWPTTSG